MRGMRAFCCQIVGCVQKKEKCTLTGMVKVAEFFYDAKNNNNNKTENTNYPETGGNPLI